MASRLPSEALDLAMTRISPPPIPRSSESEPASAAIGITTFNRPAFAEKCAKSVTRHLPGTVEAIYLYNDGSDPKHHGAYERVYKPLRTIGASIIDCPENRGVAYAKNRLLEMMLEETDAEWLFLIEDDMKIEHPRAITRYIRAAQRAGLHHLSFAHHGPANAAGPVFQSGDIEFYEHSIGAFTMFSRESLLKVGLFDENLHNAWEHVEHELRLIRAGFIPGSGAHRFPDVTGSRLWISEQPGSIEKSSIRPRPDWSANIRDGLVYWRDAKPETYEMMFGPGTRLEQYALRMTIGAVHGA